MLRDRCLEWMEGGIVELTQMRSLLAMILERWKRSDL